MYRQKRKQRIAEKSLISSIIYGDLIFLVLLLLSIGGVSLAVNSGTVQYENCFMMILILTSLCSFVGSEVACVFSKRKRMIVGALVSIIGFLILAVLSALFFSGKFESIWLHLGAVMIGGLAASLLGLVERKKKYH